MSDKQCDDLLDLNQRLLDSIANRDWKAYISLCDPNLTAFEPEGVGQLIRGMKFHQFYFDRDLMDTKKQTTLCAPHVRVIGDVAIVCYVRLVQSLSEMEFENAAPITHAFEETRIWQRQDGAWKHIHFHRSRISPGKDIT